MSRLFRRELRPVREKGGLLAHGLMTRGPRRMRAAVITTGEMSGVVGADWRCRRKLQVGGTGRGGGGIDSAQESTHWRRPGGALRQIFSSLHSRRLPPVHFNFTKYETILHVQDG